MAEQERKAFVVDVRPSKAVQQFLVEHPSAPWSDCLSYVLNHWPQTADGTVQYLIEGGVAMRLLFPDRQEPDDLDIVTRSEPMATEFQNAGRFDVKLLQHWYAHRLYPYNYGAFDAQAGEFLLDVYEAVPFGDRQVLVLSRLGLAVSKTLPWGTLQPRAKDQADLALLDQDPAEVQAVIAKIKTAYSQSER